MSNTALCARLIVVTLLGGALSWLWTNYLGTLLEESGCEVHFLSNQESLINPILAAAVMLGGGVASLGIARFAAIFGARPQTARDRSWSLWSFLIGSQLGMLLRAVIVVKVAIPDSIAESERAPVVLMSDFQVAQWFAIGGGAALVMVGFVLCAIGLIGAEQRSGN